MISIVVPFYNEKENLEELCARLLKVAATFKSPWEIVFVDDGSQDGGREIVALFAQKEPRVRLLELERNTGLSAALYAGLTAAKGDLFVTLDSDLQNPPEEIPRLLALMENHDMVTGIRQLRQDDWLRRASSKVANTVRRFVLKDSIEDIGCSLRVFKRSVFERSFYPYRGVHRFFPAIAEAHGFKIKQVPVDHHPRLHGQAKYGLVNRLTDPLLDLIAIRWLLTHKIDYRLKG